MPIRLALAAAAAVALSAGAASAQPAPPAGGPPSAMHGRDHGDMSGRMEAERMKRMDALHTLLRLRPNQEAAWSRWVQDTAMSHEEWQAERAEAPRMSAMTTPQRLDAVMKMMDEHTAAFRRRADATKAFYAQLSPDQQKSFDAAEELGGPGAHHGRHGPMHGHK
ncbi:MAG: Spy/CpxP family protein refolding chaperone [Caulobacteraceae bacterium]|nr:Spy/CpxP family protein refolding chaperone [Caulobacter sp.]